MRLNLLKLATAAEVPARARAARLLRLRVTTSGRVAAQVDEAVAALVQACAEQHTSGDAAAAAALVTADAHVPYLLRLPAGTDLHAHALVESGRVILQVRCASVLSCCRLRR